MKVLADFCIVPIGVGVSLSEYVAACGPVLAKLNVETHIHAFGTNIEGEWNEVLEAIKCCHETIHSMGTPRILTRLTLSTRTDREQSIEEKIESVTKKLRKREE